MDQRASRVGTRASVEVDVMATAYLHLPQIRYPEPIDMLICKATSRAPPSTLCPLSKVPACTAAGQSIVARCVPGVRIGSRQICAAACTSACEP